MSGSIFWRAVAVQAGGVAILSVVLALALPHEFFDDWGWLAGPAAWAVCAAVTARLLELPLRSLFGLWCARLGARGIAWTSG